MRNHKVLFSSKNHEWLTPLALFNPIRDAFKIRLDPCADDKNSLDVPVFYTKKGNGLEYSWIDNSFINPPYSDIGIWVDKTIKEYLSRNKNYYVMLLPSRTDRPWFIKLLLASNTIVFLKKRVRFSGMKSGAPFPSIIAVLHEGELNRQQTDVLDNLGTSISKYTVSGLVDGIPYVQ